MARQLELRHRNPIFGLQSLLASHASWSDTRAWISKLILLFGLQGLIWILWSRNQPFSRPGLQRRSRLTRYHLFVSTNPDFHCSLSSACSSIRRTEGFWVLGDGWRVEGWLLSVVTGSAPLSAAWLLLCLSSLYQLWWRLAHSTWCHTSLRSGLTLPCLPCLLRGSCSVSDIVLDFCASVFSSRKPT